MPYEVRVHVDDPHNEVHVERGYGYRAALDRARALSKLDSFECEPVKQPCSEGETDPAGRLLVLARIRRVEVVEVPSAVPQDVPLG